MSPWPVSGRARVHRRRCRRRARRGLGRYRARRSAARITFGSCSTTTSVLPASRSLRMTPTMRSTSRGCRPIEGSSSTNRVLTSEVPSAVVRLMRWTSPPDSVRDWRSRVRYPKPTSVRGTEGGREFPAAIAASPHPAARAIPAPRRTGCRLSMGSSMTSRMLRPRPGSPKRHNSASGFRRAPVTLAALGVGAVARQQHADVHLVGFGLQPRKEAPHAVPDILGPLAVALDHPARARRRSNRATAYRAAMPRFLANFTRSAWHSLIGLGLPGLDGTCPREGSGPNPE